MTIVSSYYVFTIPGQSVMVNGHGHGVGTNGLMEGTPDFLDGGGAVNQNEGAWYKIGLNVYPIKPKNLSLHPVFFSTLKIRFFCL